MWVFISGIKRGVLLLPVLVQTRATFFGSEMLANAFSNGVHEHVIILYGKASGRNRLANGQRQ